jgi:flavorubredoxin
MNVTISDTIKYIGVDDLTLDLFESQYILEEGISYNSYLILDEKTCLMDTVDVRGMEEWEQNLARELGDRPLDYLVVHHVEPDHAGSLGRLLELHPEVTLVGNAKTFQMLPQFFAVAPEIKTITVKEGDTLALGSHTLTFILAPMVHWPEVMVSYESTEKLLFSADGFGTFGAISKRGLDDWACEARRYYFNIVGKYGIPVQTLLKKAATLDIRMICPLHGPMLAENLEYYIGLYDTWSKYEPENKGILVAYASIHGNTAQAAQLLADMLKEAGEEKVAITDLARDDMAEAVEDAFRYDRMVLCAASYDGGVFLPMEQFLVDLSYKTYQNRTVALVENGSWAPSAAKKMRDYLSAMKNVEVLEDVVTIRSTLKEENKEQLKQLADRLVSL